MLKKIGLTALFAITFAVGMGVAEAKTTPKKVATTITAQGLCGWGLPGCS